VEPKRLCGTLFKDGFLLCHSHPFCPFLLLIDISYCLAREGHDLGLKEINTV